MSTSEFSPRWPDPVQVDIRAEDGASELILINSSYDVVGKAIGNLSLEVSPGEYHVRQRIGDSESIQRIDIDESPASHKVQLKPLDFVSPAPILGTSSFPEGSLDDWRKPAELVGKPGIRLAIRNPGTSASTPPSKALLAHMSLEKARLRLETLQGEVVTSYSESNGSANFEDSALFLRDVEVPPGCYILVHSDGDMQQCLPLIVHAKWSPRVYLFCLRDQDSQEGEAFIPICLDNASIIYWPTTSGSSPDQSDLVRVEAARKSLARGRNTGGYVQVDANDASIPAARDPMLALIDAYLLLKDMTKDEIERARSVIDSAADALGNDFPDVIALRLAFARSTVVTRSPGASAFGVSAVASLPAAPPMLAHSWRYLLSSSDTSARLSELMPSTFAPEPSSTWFVWHEPKGARHQKPKPDDVSSQLRSHASAGQSGAPRMKAGDDALSAASKALAVVLQIDAVKGWVDSLLKRTHESNPEQRLSLDPRLLRLVERIAAVQDPLLVRAFGAQELARRLLLSFNLPSDRLNDLPALLSTALEDSGLRRGFVPRLLAALKQYTTETAGEELPALIKLLGRATKS